MEESGQQQTPAALPLGKRPVPIEKEDVWAPEPFWNVSRRESGIRTYDLPVRSLITISSTIVH